MKTHRLRVIVPMSITDDYPFDFNLCMFVLGAEFFRELRRFAVFVRLNELESVTKLTKSPGFYSDTEDDCGLRRIDFRIDCVTLNITRVNVYWSGTVFGRNRDVYWKTHAVPFEELFLAEREKEELDYRS